MTAKKILLVDDTRLFLELEKNYLRLSPVRVLTASSGEEALEIAGKERPDLVFMDVHMPGMGGIACCCEMKSDPSLRSIPVVMVTTSGRLEDLELCREAGCDGYVTKPVDRKEFLEKARQHLDAVDRREPRIPYRTQVSIISDGLSLSGSSADLSCGGVYVVSDRTLEEKRDVMLEMAMPGAEGSIVRTKGTVAWENSSGNRRKPALPTGFGVEFVGMREKDGDLIRSLIEKRRREG